LGIWNKGSNEEVSSSGHGSSQHVNEEFIQYLNALVQNHLLSLMVDIGSGDWSYMKHTIIPYYTGSGVSSSIVNQTTILYASSNVSFCVSEA
tara:strand:+ start:136 stop:411 length:276 start_codon:yes stop_codon:yes gene_type:complete